LFSSYTRKYIRERNASKNGIQLKDNTEVIVLNGASFLVGGGVLIPEFDVNSPDEYSQEHSSLLRYAADADQEQSHNIGNGASLKARQVWDVVSGGLQRTDCLFKV
jgi:hypothetical protein